MSMPPGSSLPMRVLSDGRGTPGPSNPNSQICSFAIPLITIVAFFVFRLFLPIVVLIFGLWFLLKLKFCIPPSVDVSVDMTFELQASKAGLDVNVDVHGNAQDVRQNIHDAIAVAIPIPLAGEPNPMPGDGYDGKRFHTMTDDASISDEDLLDVYMSQRSKPSDPGFDYPPPLAAGAVPSPNATLAPLIWEDELPIPELEEVA
jgi:hypothetical protein